MYHLFFFVCLENFPQVKVPNDRAIISSQCLNIKINKKNKFSLILQGCKKTSGVIRHCPKSYPTVI